MLESTYPGFGCWVGLWCWTPLSNIFQLYRGGQFYWLRKSEYPVKTTDITWCIEYTSKWTRFELLTLVVIDTDCIGSCKSNYHTITTTTVPSWFHDRWMLYTKRVYEHLLTILMLCPCSFYSFVVVQWGLVGGKGICADLFIVCIYMYLYCHWRSNNPEGVVGSH